MGYIMLLTLRIGVRRCALCLHIVLRCELLPNFEPYRRATSPSAPRYSSPCFEMHGSPAGDSPIMHVEALHPWSVNFRIPYLVSLPLHLVYRAGGQAINYY